MSLKPQNDFKAFSISNNANVVSQERYEESRSLKNGFPPDNVTTHELNKVLRQSSTISSVVANFIATHSGGDDVLDDGDIAKLTAQLNSALEKKITTEIPSTSLTQKGIVQLTNKTGDSNTLAVTQKLASDINDNANNKLAKDRNGADIPDKNEFVKNLGLTETVNQAKNAVPISSTLSAQVGGLRINNASDWPHIEFVASNKHLIGIEGTRGNRLTIYANDENSNRRYTLATPEKSGTLATVDDVISTNGGVVGKNSYSTIDNFDNVRPNSTYFGYANETMNAPAETGAGIRFSHSATGPFKLYDLMIHSAYGSGTLYYRSKNGDGAGKWNPWYMVWSTLNAKPDSNGFLKRASPIIEIYPNGTFSTNNESEGAEVTKEGVGIYHISNVCGYNLDIAWGVHGGISVPKDNNNLELIFVDDRVQSDGSVIIETFHRQHTHLPTRFQNWRLKHIDENGERVFYKDSEPCDIPEHCRLDVRVQMPQDSIWNQKQQALI
ncbi:phage tail protein [Photorhabdus caribbeanensis]|uniref:phage tail protein n=1 Tax=Photorhabdus caribbeanensis TaxID=1004165 RepID=UPI001FE9104E|nr:phage tail protein [Photorhabdus caribbeanensis]